MIYRGTLHSIKKNPMKKISTKQLLTIFTLLILSITLFACSGNGNNSSVNNASKLNSTSLVSDTGDATESSINQYAYVVDTTDSRIYMYSAANGILTSLTDPTTKLSYIQMDSKSMPTSITISPNKRYAYVPNSGSSGISIYSINQQTGVLSLSGTAASPTGVSNPIQLVMTSRTNYAYVTSCNVAPNTTCNITPQVSLYQVESQTGGLTLLSTNSAPKGYMSFPSESMIGVHTAKPSTNIVLDSTNHYLYVGNAIMDNSVHPFHIYHIDPDSGDLIESGTSNAIGQTIAMQMLHGNLYTTSYTGVSGSGGYLSTSMQQLLNGELTYVQSINAGSSTDPTYSKPLAVTSTGNYVYTADTLENNLYMFSITNPYTGGFLAPLSPATTYSYMPHALAIGDDDQYLYVINDSSKDQNSSYSSYAIDESSGELAIVQSTETLGTTSAHMNAMAIVNLTNSGPYVITDDYAYEGNFPVNATIDVMFNDDVDQSTVVTSGESKNVFVYQQTLRSTATTLGLPIAPQTPELQQTSLFVWVAVAITSMIWNTNNQVSFDVPLNYGSRYMFLMNGEQNLAGNTETPLRFPFITQVSAIAITAPQDTNNVRLEGAKLMIKYPKAVRSVSLQIADSTGKIVSSISDRVNGHEYYTKTVIKETQQPLTNYFVTGTVYYDDDTSDSTIKLSYTTTNGPRVISPAVLNNVVLQPEFVIEYPQELDTTTDPEKAVEIVDMMGNIIPSITKIYRNSTWTKPKSALGQNVEYYVNTNIMARGGKTAYRVSKYFYTRRSDSLRIFETFNTYTGSISANNNTGILLGGKYAADWICNHDPMHQAYYQDGRVFKAMIAYNKGLIIDNNLAQDPGQERYGCRWVPARYSGTGQNERRCGVADAIDWSIQPNATYSNDLGLVVGNTDENGMWTGNAANYGEISNTISILYGGSEIWTGLKADYTPDSQTADGSFNPTADNPSGYVTKGSCRGWTNNNRNNPLSSYIGNSGGTTGAEIANIGSSDCYQLRRLVCAQQ